MKLKRFRVKNYRSFGEETELHLIDSNVLIGPNNVGKTNFLLAIQEFFAASYQTQTYNYKRDFPKHIATGRTTMVAVFSPDDTENDNLIIDKYDLIRRKMKISAKRDKEIPIHLQFSEKGTPSYSLFPGRPTYISDFQSWQEELIELVLQQFDVIYISPEKELKNIYNKLVVGVVKQEISDQLDEVIKSFERQADLISQEINSVMKDLGMSDTNVFLEVPPTLEDFITNLNMTVMDRHEDDLFQKSKGIQWLVIACCIAWLSRSVSRRNGTRCVWLIEEPESYLHPELFPKQRRIFDFIGKSSDLIYTTHSLGFVPSDVKSVTGVTREDRQSTFVRFNSYKEATNHIRTSLGVRFSDYFQLGSITIAMEGKSDIEYLSWFLALARVRLHGSHQRWPNLLRAEFVEFEGVRGLGAFVRANYSFIREEVAFVPLFDGDEAGRRETQALRRYLNSQKVPVAFNSGTDYVLLPNGHPIEGLFPDEFLVELIRNHPSWYEDQEIDAGNKVISIKIVADKKSNFLKTVTLKAEQTEFSSWSARWVGVCDALEACLQQQRKKTSSRPADSGALAS